MPERLEFIQISLYRETRSILLVESPEPVAWERISTRLTATDGTITEVGALFNEDQTRAFLFHNNTFKFDHGTYELQLTFDGSINPEAGVLFEDGVEVNETLDLRLNVS